MLVFATNRDDTIRLTVGGVGDISGLSWLNTEHVFLQTTGEVTVEVLDSRSAHKWLGRMLQAAQGGNPSADLQHQFASSVTGFACKSLDPDEPPGFCQRSPYIPSCTSDPSGMLRSGPPENQQELAATPSTAPPRGWSPCWHGYKGFAGMKVGTGRARWLQLGNIDAGVYQFLVVPEIDM